MKKLNKRILLFLILMLCLASGLSYLGFNQITTQEAETETEAETEEAREEQTMAMDIALVNEDNGATFNDEELSFGDRFVQSMDRDGSHEWYVVSRGVAENGLENDTYDMMMVVPNDFSERALSMEAESPEQVSLDYKINTSGNPRVQAEAEKTASDILNDVNRRIIDVYFASIIGSLQNAQDNIGSIVERQATHTYTYNNAVHDPLRSYTDRFSDVQDNTERSIESFSGLEEILESFDNSLNNQVDQQADTNQNYLSAMEDYMELREVNNHLTEDFTRQQNDFRTQINSGDLSQQLTALEEANQAINDQLQQDEDDSQAMAADAAAIQNQLDNTREQIAELDEYLQHNMDADMQSRVGDRVSGIFEDVSDEEESDLTVLFDAANSQAHQNIQNQIDQLPPLDMNELRGLGLSGQTMTELENVITVTEKYKQAFGYEPNYANDRKTLPQLVWERRSDLAGNGVDVRDTVNIPEEIQEPGSTFTLNTPAAFEESGLTLLLNGEEIQYEYRDGQVILPPLNEGELTVQLNLRLRNEQAEIDIFQPVTWSWGMDLANVEEKQEQDQEEGEDAESDSPEPVALWEAQEPLAATMHTETSDNEAEQETEESNEPESGEQPPEPPENPDDSTGEDGEEETEGEETNEPDNPDSDNDSDQEESESENEEDENTDSGSDGTGDEEPNEPEEGTDDEDNTDENENEEGNEEETEGEDNKEDETEENEGNEEEDQEEEENEDEGKEEDEEEENEEPETVHITDHRIQHQVDSSLTNDATESVIHAAADTVSDYQRALALYENYFGINMRDNVLGDQALTDLASDDSLYNLFHHAEIESVLEDSLVNLVTDEVTREVMEPTEQLQEQIQSYYQMVDDADENAEQLSEDMNRAVEQAGETNLNIEETLQALSAWHEESMNLIDEQENVQMDGDGSAEQPAIMTMDSDLQSILSETESLAGQADTNLSAADDVYQTFDTIDEQASDIQESGVTLVEEAETLSDDMTESVLDDQNYAENFAGVLANSRVGDRQNEDLYDFLSDPVGTNNQGVIGTGGSGESSPSDERSENTAFTPYFLVLICFIVALFTAYVISTNNQKRMDKDQFAEDKSIVGKNLPATLLTVCIGIVEGLVIGLTAGYLLQIGGESLFLWVSLITLIMPAMLLVATYLLRQLKMIGMFILLIILSLYLFLTDALAVSMSQMETVRAFSPLQYIETLVANMVNGTANSLLGLTILAGVAVIGAAANLFVFHKQEKEETEDEEPAEAN